MQEPAIETKTPASLSCTPPGFDSAAGIPGETRTTPAGNQECLRRAGTIFLVSEGGASVGAISHGGMPEDAHDAPNSTQRLYWCRVTYSRVGRK